MSKTLLIILILALTGCDMFKHEWTGIILPYGYNDEVIHIGVFHSDPACAYSAIYHLNKMGISDGIYKCGLNCRPGVTHIPEDPFLYCEDVKGDTGTLGFMYKDL